MSVSLITRKACLTLIGTVFASSALSISVASSPSSEFLYIGAPSFYAEMDAAGYSDWIYWGESERHNASEYHEVLSGEWGGAVYYDGIDTEFIDPNNQSLGRKAMWLTDNDCRVNMLDFARMGSNWLIHCNTYPYDPACVAK